MDKLEIKTHDAGEKTMDSEKRYWTNPREKRWTEKNDGQTGIEHGRRTPKRIERSVHSQFNHNLTHSAGNPATSKSMTTTRAVLLAACVAFGIGTQAAATAGKRACSTLAQLPTATSAIWWCFAAQLGAGGGVCRACATMGPCLSVCPSLEAMACGTADFMSPFT